MSLREKINSDFKEAFKGHQEARVSTLRMFLAAIKNKELEKRAKLSKSEPAEKLEDLSVLSDEEIIIVGSSEIKKRRDSAEQYKKGGRPELAQKEEEEAAILSGYLPAFLSEEELTKIIDDTIRETGINNPKDMGRLMAALMPKVRSQADGNLVSKIVKEKLGG